MATKRKLKLNKTAAKKTRTPAHDPHREHGTLPQGYKIIGRAPNWDPQTHPVIEGPRGETNEIIQDKGTPNERTVRTCVVKDKALGVVTVWESGMLRDFFNQTEAEQVVRIEFMGLGVAKKGQSAPKLFTCAVKE